MKDDRLLLAGQVIGQSSLVLVTPILTRAVSPSEFGLFQVGLALALIAQPLATLRNEFVIPGMRKNDAARRRASLSNRLTLALAALLGLIALVSLAFDDGAAIVLLVTALVLMTYGWMAIDNAVLIRAARLRRLGLRNALAGVLASVLQVVLCLLLPNALGLALGLFLGRLVALVVTVTRAAAVESEHDDAPVGARRTIWSVASGVVANASVHAPVLVSGAAFGGNASGHVGLSQRIAGAPTSLLGQALGQLVTAQIAPLVRDGNPRVTQATSRFVGRTVALGLLCASVIALAGPLLAGPILGPEWAQAGVFLAIFAVPLSLQVAAAPITPIFIMLGREGTLLLVQTTRLAAMVIAAVVVAVLSHDLVWTCLAMAAAWTADYVMTLFLVVAFARAFDRAARVEATSGTSSAQST